MKRIEKRDEPLRLREWKRTTVNFPDAHYNSHEFPAAAVNQALVAEQGGLCGYTMIRITEATSHNEHIKPRSVSKNEVPPRFDETSDFLNLIACYPNTGSSGGKCPFGAEVKGNAWDPENMVTPLMGNCEARFAFEFSGKVAAANSDDEAAKWTIDTLCLDHEQLRTLRKQACHDACLTPDHPSPLTARQALELAENICNRSKSGTFAPFCVVIRQVATVYAKKLEAAKLKRKHATRSLAKKEKRK